MPALVCEMRAWPHPCTRVCQRGRGQARKGVGKCLSGVGQGLEHAFCRRSIRPQHRHVCRHASSVERACAQKQPLRAALPWWPAACWWRARAAADLVDLVNALHRGKAGGEQKTAQDAPVEANLVVVKGVHLAAEDHSHHLHVRMSSESGRKTICHLPKTKDHLPSAICPPKPIRITCIFIAGSTGSRMPGCWKAPDIHSCV